MNLNKPRKSIKLLIFLCIGMCFVLMIGGFFLIYSKDGLFGILINPSLLEKQRSLRS